MDFKSYPNYKDSGVEWLGEVPRHWILKPIKFLSKINQSTLAETTDENLDIQYVDIGSVSATYGIEKIEQYVFSQAPSRARRIVADKDIIVSTVRTYLKAITYIENPPKNLIVSTGFAVLTPIERVIKPQFAKYAFLAEQFIAEVISKSKGISYPAITASELAAIKIALPPIEEQSAITSFLDSETSRIDNLIAKQEKLIETLEEHRKSVISHAVTKGLDPNVPMKDSGVEWLGEVPEHWGCGKFTKVVQSYLSGCWGDDPYDDERNTIVLRSTEQTVNGFWKIENPATRYISPKEIKGKYLKRNDLLLTKSSGSSNHIGKTTLVDENVEAMNCTFSNFMMCIRLSGKVFPKFYWYILNSKIGRSQFDFLSQTTTGLSNLNESHVGSLIVPMLSIEEQKEIANFLDLESHKINKTIDTQKQLIEKLKEYRTSIISHAVTGKIDVRDLVA